MNEPKDFDEREAIRDLDALASFRERINDPRLFRKYDVAFDSTDDAELDAQMTRLEGQPMMLDQVVIVCTQLRVQARVSFEGQLVGTFVPADERRILREFQRLTEREVMALAAAAKEEAQRRECEWAGCPRHARHEGPDANCIDGRSADAVPPRDK